MARVGVQVEDRCMVVIANPPTDLNNLGEIVSGGSPWILKAQVKVTACGALCTVHCQFPELGLTAKSIESMARQISLQHH